MVPEMSNMPEAFDSPRKYQGSSLPPRRYESRLLAALFVSRTPIEVTAIM
jgi:hypothetical protein